MLESLEKLFVSESFGVGVSREVKRKLFICQVTQYFLEYLLDGVSSHTIDCPDRLSARRQLPAVNNRDAGFVITDSNEPAVSSIQQELSQEDHCEDHDNEVQKPTKDSRAVLGLACFVLAAATLNPILVVFTVPCAIVLSTRVNWAYFQFAPYSLVKLTAMGSLTVATFVVTTLIFGGV